MKLIPVIDLKGGQVVAAKLGQRRSYAPVHSPLCPCSALRAVVDALLRLHPFETLYIADLDAIERRGGHLSQIAELKAAHPELNLWLDAGVDELATVERLARPVIGSESLESSVQLEGLLAVRPDAILSLDHRGRGFLGPDGLDQRPSAWPADVILMTLARVGSGQGPDLEHLARLRRMIPEKQIYAAGGVRGPADLVDLHRLGVDGALVSTALHQGRLTASDIAELTRNRDQSRRN